MKYISKGMVIKASTEELLFVTRHGTDFQLTDLQAELWLNGRYGFAESGGNILERKALQQLNRQGLVELVESDEPAAEYLALTQCVLVPAQPQGHRVLLSTQEKELLRWLTDAGLHLTAAELVFLAEHRVMPTADLLGERNRQRLTERIYTQETTYSFYHKTNRSIISIQYSFYDFHTGIRRAVIHYNALYPSTVCLINNRLDTFLNIFFNIVDRNDHRQLYFHIHLFMFSFLQNIKDDSKNNHKIACI